MEQEPNHSAHLRDAVQHFRLRPAGTRNWGKTQGTQARRNSDRKEGCARTSSRRSVSGSRHTPLRCRTTPLKSNLVRDHRDNMARRIWNRLSCFSAMTSSTFREKGSVAGPKKARVQLSLRTVPELPQQRAVDHSLAVPKSQPNNNGTR